MKTKKTMAILCLVLGGLLLLSAVTRLVVGSTHSLASRTAQWISGNLQLPSVPDLPDNFGNAVSDNSTLTIPLDQIKTISLKDQAGKVEVHTDPQAKVATLQITKSISANTMNEDQARAQLPNLRVQETRNGDIANIEAVFPENNSTPWNGYRVDLTLTVPPTIAIDAELKAGEFSTSGLQSPVSANVDIGKIQIIGYSDSVKAITNTGSISIEGGQNIKNIDAETNIGEVQVSLPANANLKIDATTSIGSIHSALPLNGSEAAANRSLHGQIGTGQDGQVTLVTKTGAININRE